MSRLAGVFAPRRKGAPTAERLAEVLGASADSFAAGALSVAWTPGTPAQSEPVLGLAVGTSGVDPGAAIETMQGRFALVRWDAARDEGLLAVDKLGAASLFLHDDGAQLTFATELVDLLRMLPRRPAPYSPAVVRWLADGSTERGDTLFEGVTRLPGGHLVRLNDEGWKSVRYWSPRYAPGTRDDHQRRLRAEVEAAVERAQAGSSKPGLLLSGGLDSTTVAALATRRPPAGSAPLRSYSAVFPQVPDVDESALIETVSSRLDVQSRQIPVTRVSIMPAAEEYIGAWGLPPGSPLLAVHRPLLECAQKDGIDVLLDGQGGDELFGNSQYLVADKLRSGHLLTAARLARIVSPNEPTWRTLLDLGAKGSVPHLAHMATKLYRPAKRAPHWLRPEAARLYVEQHDGWAWKQLGGPRWWAFLADQLTAQRERSGVHDYLRHKASLASAEGKHPFLQDLELIEFVLSLPPELAFDPSVDRPLLRRSMSGVVPDEIRLRTEKPHFTRIFVDAMTRTEHDVIAEALGRKAEVYAFVRGEAIERLFRATDRERRAFTWAWALWRLAVCERWLQAQS